MAALDMAGVSKVYGKTRVLDDASFVVRVGAVHALVGHNGAGKSTLMKIALGATAPSSGRVAIGGHVMSYATVTEARDAGAGMVFQELSTIPTLSVVDNIFLNAERTRAGVISRRAEKEEAAQLVEDLGIEGISLDTQVGDLSIAQQQLVEILKAVRVSHRLLILDEPTASLSGKEIEALFSLVRRAVMRGLGVVLITHHLREVFEICDEVTVLRDGKVTLHSATSDVTMDQLVTAMVGDKLSAQDFGAPVPRVDDAVPSLTVDRLEVSGKLAEVGFEVYPGEIVGVLGLAGSGRSTLLKTLFGVVAATGGEVRLGARPLRPQDPAQAIARGVYLVPEDRLVHGVMIEHSIEANIVLSVLRRMRRGIGYRNRLSRKTAQDMFDALAIRASGIQQAVGELSGGNQQKVVFGKALVADPTLFLLDEPTVGVDVATAAEIMRLAREKVMEGRAAVWVSSELDELLQVSDRVLVLADGRIHSEIVRGDPDFSEQGLVRRLHTAESNDEDGRHGA